MQTLMLGTFAQHNQTTGLYNLDLMRLPFHEKLHLREGALMPAPTPGDGTPGSRMPHIAVVAAMYSEADRSFKRFLSTNYARQIAEHSWTRSWTPWMSLRTSAAAPGFFTHVMIGKSCSVDGGIVANSPVMLAIHEYEWHVGPSLGN